MARRRARKITRKITTKEVADPVTETPDAVLQGQAAPRAWAKSDGTVPPGHSSRNRRLLASEEEGLLQETRRDPEVDINVEQFLSMAVMELVDGDTTTGKVNKELQALFLPSMNGRQRDQLLQRIKAYLIRTSKAACDLAKVVSIQ